MYEERMEIYNVNYYGIGVMTLWFGWLFFNSGSTLSVQDELQEEAERAMMNSIVGPAAGGLMGFAVRKYLAGSTPDFREVKYDSTGILNGVLCGLVAVTGNCAYIMAWAAIVIGGLAPIFYSLLVRLCNRLKIDDAAEAFQIHGACGAWGIFATAFFHTTEGVFYGYSGRIIGV
jgi:Amt family ammonium transporter